MAEKDICKVLLKDVRLSYPQLFRAKAFGDGSQGEPAFSAEFLVSKDSSPGKAGIRDIEDAIEEAKYKKWGDDPKKWPKISKDKPFFKDGDDPDWERPETVDHMIVSARNVKKPRLLGIDKEDLHESDGVLYAGCRVDAIVRVWAQDNKFGKRVNCSLEAVRFRADGEAFGAAPIDPDEFEDIEGGEDDRRSSRRSRDDDRGDDSRSSRRSRDDDEGSRGRGRDEDDRDSRRSRDDDDDRSERRSSRDRDDDDADDRGSRRRSREDEDDDDRGSRDTGRSARGGGRDRDEDDNRGSRRSRDSGDDDRGSRRSSRDEDDEDRPSRNSRSRGRDDDRGI